MPACGDLDPERSLWHFIASQLRFHREQRGLSETRVGELIDRTRSVVSRYESATIRLPMRIARIIDEAWNTNHLFTRLVGFANAAQDGDYLVGLSEWERRATRLRMWEVALIPGLLQTETYARALLVAGLGSDVDGDLQRRLERQEAVFGRQEPPQISVMLNWTCLAHPVGGAAVMHEQIEHLVKATDNPHISIRIVQDDVGAHPGLDGAFELITTAEGRDVAYSDDVSSGRLVVQPTDVANYALRYDRIGDVAVPRGPSKDLITQALEKYAC
jgi:hypothetical protein